MSEAYFAAEISFRALCRPRKISLFPSHGGVTFRRSVQHEKVEVGGTVAMSSAAALTY